MQGVRPPRSEAYVGRPAKITPGWPKRHLSPERQKRADRQSGVRLWLWHIFQAAPLGETTGIEQNELGQVDWLAHVGPEPELSGHAGPDSQATRDSKRHCTGF